VLDDHLVAIAEAIHARHELLHTINSQKPLAMLTVGDRVRINHHASLRYLHGTHGVITELDSHTALVCVHRPIGRFKSGEIRCPPLVLDRLNPPPDEREPVSPTRHADPELDQLIDEITVDAHDEDEQLMGFEAAFDENASFPCPGTVVGHQVEILSVARADNRHELIATCRRDDRRYQIALLDVDLNADPLTSRLIAAYRRWSGA
jgi:hypothetical protein